MLHHDGNEHTSTAIALMIANMVVITMCLLYDGMVPGEGVRMGILACAIVNVGIWFYSDHSQF